jgi:hypothetical protein
MHTKPEITDNAYAWNDHAGNDRACNDHAWNDRWNDHDLKMPEPEMTIAAAIKHETTAPGFRMRRKPKTGTTLSKTTMTGTTKQCLERPRLEYLAFNGISPDAPI